MLKASLQLRLGQQLTMTPQLQQAIRLLQLPSLELQAHIRELLESNVMLEAEEDTEATATFEALGAGPNDRELPPGATDEGARHEAQGENAEPSVEIVEDGWTETSAAPGESSWNGEDEDRQQEFQDGRGESLPEHLQWQLEMAALSERQRAVGRAILDAIKRRRLPDRELRCDSGDPQARDRRRRHGNRGHAAHRAGFRSHRHRGPRRRRVRQSAAARAGSRHPGPRTALTLAQGHLDQVANRELALLRRELKVSEEELEQALVLVRGCHPRRPGAQISSSAPQYVVPDVFVRRSASGWTVEMNSATVPRVRLNESYASLIGRAASHATMRTQLQEARWLLKSLEIRHDTLMKVARSIVERQHEFLDQARSACGR